MKKRFTAFTLVELLVVIAIVSVLAALLLPVLSKAQESARSVSCMSSMKQIGIASLTEYAEDWKGVVPNGINYLDSGNTSGLKAYHYCMLATYLGYSTGPGLWDINRHKMLDIVLNCPSSNNPNPPPQYITSYPDYSPNCEIQGNRTLFGKPTSDAHRSPYVLSRIKHPVDVVYYGECKFSEHRLKRDASSSGNVHQFRHNLRSNGLFFDGHIEQRAIWYRKWHLFPHGDTPPP